ncbi:MAG TPA: RDD family protein [Alphaproteobacteria bacterium]|nr:RDD family protein [Alphaproteobacteria bacterium]
MATGPDTGGPDQPQFVYAGFGARFGASFIDSFVLIACALAVGGLSRITESNPAWQDDVDGVAGLVFLVAVFLYEPLMESSRWHATLGKLALNLGVTDEDGHAISFGRALARSMSKILSSVLYIGFIMAAFTRRKQALHDLIAHTIVIQRGNGR